MFSLARKTQNTKTDMDLVSEASCILEISDFEFWQLASKNVHYDFSERTLEKMFGTFIMVESKEMPPFVSDFARDVLFVSVEDAHRLLDTDGAYLIA